MQRPGIPGRPNRPLVVRCEYDGSTRRVNFPSAATCRLDSLLQRVEECFALSVSRFFLTYTDDDGEEFPIKTEDDLTETIAYYDDDHDQQLPVAIRVEVVIEYDGPSLSDTSSIADFSEYSSRSSRRSFDSRSYRSRRSRHSTLDQTASTASAGTSSSMGSSALGMASPAPPPALSHRIFGQSSVGSLQSTSEEPYMGSLLAGSELGSRWLREQSQLATRLPRLHISSDSDESDEESLGDIALVRDARGRYYYSYQSDADTASLAGPSRLGPFSPPQSPPLEVARAPEPMSSPILAPDCSACGVRLEYMRYVCTACGEADMWTVNAKGKAPFVPPRLPPSESEDTSSDGTWVRTTSESQTAYTRSRSGSISTTVTNGSAASPTSPHFAEAPSHAPRGYELCPGCIEQHGIAHAKAAKIKRRKRLRHTFREMVWGAEGWISVDYAEDSECTICRSTLFHNRFKCVSCPKFDLCRSCYQKVEEIHPVHVFLSLPDKPLPQLAQPPPSSSRGVATGPVHHPGAFCHNCLQDIVGPRFHCAVCPSWDLCIQCEGVSAPGDGQHTADHIMMKIPIPLATAEVEAVSRRARDRWFQQDSSTVNRTSSPSLDTETVYASETGTRTTGRATPSTVRSRATVLTIRDDLDHNARCANCKEWIMGRRYQCANCPSDPEPYNLCSICELRSYRLHDPGHVFFKFDRPVHLPLQSPYPLLPLLYKSRVGQVPATAVLNPRDPTAYLKHVLHRDTLCDIHSDQIRGIWLRCAHCAAGFDMCSEAEQVADHDATHVFVVFKARVDMAAFRQLANLAATHSKPLLSQQVYLH